MLRPGQIWSSIFYGIFFRALDIHFSWEAKERDAPVVSAFSSVWLLVYGDNHSVCYNAALLETPGNLIPGII